MNDIKSELCNPAYVLEVLRQNFPSGLLDSLEKSENVKGKNFRLGGELTNIRKDSGETIRLHFPIMCDDNDGYSGVFNIDISYGGDKISTSYNGHDPVSGEQLHFCCADTTCSTWGACKH